MNEIVIVDFSEQETPKHNQWSTIKSRQSDTISKLLMAKIKTPSDYSFLCISKYLSCSTKAGISTTELR